MPESRPDAPPEAGAPSTARAAGPRRRLYTLRRYALLKSDPERGTKNAGVLLVGTMMPLEEARLYPFKRHSYASRNGLIIP